jgi:hypothetical protein
VIGRAGVAFLPGLGLATVRAVALAIPRGAFAIPATEILARTSVRCTARKLLVAAKLSLGTIATGTVTVTRRPCTIGAISLRPISLETIAVLAETFAARGIGSFLATAVPRCVRFLVTEFPVGKSRGRAGIAAILARGGALFAARRIIPVEARRGALTLAGVGLARTRIGLFAIGLVTIRLDGIGTPLAIAFAGKATFGELLLRTPGGPRAALAASGTALTLARAALAVARPITPAAGIIVFVVIAGHEGSHCR